MKFMYGMVIMAVLLATLASATPGSNLGFESECQTVLGGDQYYAIEKWAFDDEEEDYLLDEESLWYFAIDVTGDYHEADWTADPAVYKVLVKAGNTVGNTGFEGYTQFDGGASGTVTSEKEISHITFCGYRSGNGGGNGGNGVPEFPSFALGAAVLTATLGIVILRKK